MLFNNRLDTLTFADENGWPRISVDGQTFAWSPEEGRFYMLKRDIDLSGGWGWLHIDLDVDQTSLTCGVENPEGCESCQ